jgi:hypothetical protein
VYMHAVSTLSTRVRRVVHHHWRSVFICPLRMFGITGRLAMPRRVAMRLFPAGRIPARAAVQLVLWAKPCLPVEHFGDLFSEKVGTGTLSCGKC